MRFPELKPETQCWLVCAIGASVIQFVSPSQSNVQACQNAIMTTSIFASAAIVTQIRSENS